MLAYIYKQIKLDDTYTKILALE